MNNGRKVLLSFLLGVAVGGALLFAGAYFHRNYLREPGWGAMRKSPERFLNRFSRKLGLSEDQKAQVGRIMEAKHAEMSALRKQTRPQFKAIMDGANAEIRALLDPEQQAKFDAMIEKLEKRRMEREKKMEGKP